MNSLTNAENLKKLSEREIELGTVGTKNSWHNIYKDSAWIFVGGLPFDLTEGDVICIFSQYGEIVNINMVRDKKTGKTKGYAFICYEDQRSTILAVDNFNTTKILQRTIRVDHVKDYRPPDEDDKNVDDITKIVRAEGVAPRPLTPSGSEDGDLLLPIDGKEKKKKKKEKKTKKEKKMKKEKLDIEEKDRAVKEEPESPPHPRHQQNKSSSHSERYRNDRRSPQPDVKVEKSDSGYYKHAHHTNQSGDSNGNERHDINATAHDRRNGGEGLLKPKKGNDRDKPPTIRSPDHRHQHLPARRSADKQRDKSPAGLTSSSSRSRHSPDRERCSLDYTERRTKGQESDFRKSPSSKERRRTKSPYDRRKRSRSRDRQRRSRSPGRHHKSKRS